MNKGMISGLVLLALGLVCGLLLAGVNMVTEPVIVERQLEKVNETLEEFYDMSQYDVDIVDVNEDALETVYLLSDKDSGSLEAAVYATSAYGYQSEVKLLIAVNADRTVHAYQVVSENETDGLGSKAVTHDFGMADTSIDDLSSFDGIAGATVTSDAVLAGFEAVRDRVDEEFGG
jgi:Na+-translocating ferredoxin:NAD+ oxidoreductase RnfG subunit